MTTRQKKYESMLRKLRAKVFDYEDESMQDKAVALMHKCKAILQPAWDAEQQSQKTEQQYQQELFHHA